MKTKMIDGVECRRLKDGEDICKGDYWCYMTMMSLVNNTVGLTVGLAGIGLGNNKYYRPIPPREPTA